jgi:type IV secretory pathway VirB10-like protein
MPGDPIAADPDPGPLEPESEPSPLPPEPPLPAPLDLDRQGLLEAAAGTVIALIALFSSYDHITAIGRTIPLQQQWGVWLIAASLALVLVDAQLATRSRLREAHQRAEERDRADQERNRADQERSRADQERSRADQERNRADQERKRAAERAERQRQGIARLHRCALLGGRFQLDPSPANTNRYRAVLALMAEAPDSGV